MWHTSKHSCNVKKMNEILKDGASNLLVIADFDGTLTTSGKELPSLISVLRNVPGYLTEKYQIESKQLSEKYSAFHEDPEKMQEWWQLHFALLIASGLKKQDIEKVGRSGLIKLRDKAREFISILTANHIPLIIMSASGIGEAIPMFLEYEEINTDNIFFIINQYEWDNEGRAIAIKKPIIHSLNKNYSLLNSYPNILKAVDGRKNILLLGDSMGDLSMVQGARFDHKFTVAFLDKDSQKFPELKIKLGENFDALITDGSYDSLNQEFLNCLKSS